MNVTGNIKNCFDDAETICGTFGRTEKCHECGYSGFRYKDKDVRCE